MSPDDSSSPQKAVSSIAVQSRIHQTPPAQKTISASLLQKPTPSSAASQVTPPEELPLLVPFEVLPVAVEPAFSDIALASWADFALEPLLCDLPQPASARMNAKTSVAITCVVRSMVSPSVEWSEEAWYRSAARRST